MKVFTSKLLLFFTLIFAFYSLTITSQICDQRIAVYENQVPQENNAPLSLTNNVSDTYKVEITDTLNNITEGEIIITFNSIPIVNAVADLETCDDDTDGIVSTFDLDGQTSTILGSQSSANFTVSYHPTLADATNNVNSLTSPFTNTTADLQTIYIRVEENSTGLINTGSFNVIVHPIPNATKPVNISACDTDSDGMYTFNLQSIVTPQVLNGQDPTIFEVAYFLSQADADANTNALANPYTNSSSPETVYIRVHNIANSTLCYDITQNFTIAVSPMPDANTVGNLVLCDDAESGSVTDGIATGFMLSDQTSTILGASQPSSVFTVSYHASQADASSGTNALSSPYTNTTANTQTIYVRVINIYNSCFNDLLTFDLIVNSLVTANTVPDLELCDDDTDGIMNSFDLDSQTTTILGSQDPTTHTVTYHTSAAEASSGANPLTSPYTNTTANSQTIYVSVVQTGNSCVNDQLTFEVIVVPPLTPTFTAVADICAGESLTALPTASNNGVTGTWSPALDNTTTTTYTFTPDAGQCAIATTLDIIVNPILTPTFTAVADICAGEPLTALPTTSNNGVTGTWSPALDNTTTTTYTFTPDAGQCATTATLDITVDAFPDFQVTTPQFLCINEGPLTLTAENPAAAYSYRWTDSNGIVLSNNQNQLVISGGTYTVTAMSATGCTTSVSIVVYESSSATITSNAVSIIEDSANNSITIDTASLGIGDYEFALEDSDGNLIADYQDEPFFEHLQGGVYTLFVRDKNGCGSVSLIVPILEFPKFFTPNNDGINDTWAAQGLLPSFYTDNATFIVNRFGKVVFQSAYFGEAWDGTYNGTPLQSTDYWFQVSLTDINGGITIRKGHFSLLRK